ncbi:MAG: xanthine dehydrogenase family protein molybdopterin-binding subunit [Burkholderiaceae bacterium]
MTSLNTDAARACPGVRLVLTHADLAAAGIKSMPRPINFKRPDGSPAASPDRHLLAAQRVRYVGEPVALVVADTEAQARTACEAIEVMYEPLPHAVTLDDALAADAPRLADEPDNLVAQTRYGDADATAAAFAQAAHVVRMRNVNQRLAALTIEPRSVLAYVEGGRLTIRMSSQMPTAVRNVTAALTGIDAEKIRVMVGDVGGGFGMKTGPYPEDILVAWAAHTLQAPVKWVAERSEEFLNSVHGRDIRSELELALDDQGRILAMRLRNQGNVGAYPIQTGTAIQLMIGPWVQTSVYHVPLIDFQFQSVLTNTAPTGAYRGAGRPEAIYNMERLMDEAARQTGIDRVTLRRRNMVRPDQMPYTNAMGQTYDTGNFERIMTLGSNKPTGMALRPERPSRNNVGAGAALGWPRFWSGPAATHSKKT